MYRHWTPTTDDPNRLEYTHDGETADTAGADVRLRADRDPPTGVGNACCWHLTLVVDGVTVHDFAESHGDDADPDATPGPAVTFPATNKAAARKFASWWARVTPAPVAAARALDADDSQTDTYSTPAADAPSRL